VIGYVLDDLVLTAGLAGTGREHHRRELSRLLHGAIAGGPALDIPACCLAAAALIRPALADHLADILAAAPPGAINITGLTRTSHLDTLRASHPQIGWPIAHAAAHAQTTGRPLLTTDPHRYADISVGVLTL
jgi:hypothetical protein